MTSTDKPLLLFVCKFLPYPPKSGAALRNWEVLRRLSKIYTITLVAFRHPSWQADDFIINKYVSEVIDAAWQPYSYIKSIENVIQGLPLSVSRFANSILQQKIQDWQYKYPSHKVHISELASAILLPRSSKIDVYDAHNVEFNLCRQAAHNSSCLIRCFGQIETARIIQFEQLVITKAQKTICVSPQDLQLITHAFDIPSTNRLFVFPNGTNIPDSTSLIREPFSLLFTGQTGWHANHYSLSWFIQSVWIKIRARFPKAKLSIVGGKAKKPLKQLIQSHEGIYLYENVASVKPYLARASVAVAPLLYGSGTSLKILEYAAHKLPVVCTSVAVRGLPFNSDSVWICETIDDFVKSFDDVWYNSSQSRQKVDLCYEIVKTQFDWNITLNHLIGNDEDSCAYPITTK
jgi:polysaccharide biosynthesis protein PslH